MRTTGPQGLARSSPQALMVPTARGWGAGKGRHGTSGSRVAGLGGPALPAIPEIVPRARATRARNAPAGQTWCSGARRRRLLPQSDAAGHRHPTSVRSPAAFRSTSCSCAAGATRAPDVTAPTLALGPPPRPEASPAHAHGPPPAPPPHAARPPRDLGSRAGLGKVCRCTFGNASAPTEFLSSSWC